MQNFMGIPLDRKDESSVSAYAAACPRHRLPLGSFPTLLVTGVQDCDVPCDMVENFYSEIQNFAAGNVTVWPGKVLFHLLSII